MKVCRYPLNLALSWNFLRAEMSCGRRKARGKREESEKAFVFVLYFEPIGLFAKDLARQESGLLFDVNTYLQKI